MFTRTIEGKPLRRYTSHAPENRDDDMFSAMLVLRDPSDIENYIRHVMQSPEMGRIERDIFADLCEMRDAGQLGAPLEAPGRSVDYIAAWNSFLDGDMSDETARTVVGPVVRIIESEVVRLFNDAKRVDGPIRKHAAAPVNMDTARRRLLTIEADLEAVLKTGSSLDRHRGALSDHDASGLMRVRMENFRPLLEHARLPAQGREAYTWNRVELTELSRDLEPSF